MREEIQNEIQRCLHCNNKPCQTGCPLSNDIPTIIALVKEGKEKEAYETLRKTTILGSICGRICPHEKQCQGKCIKGIKQMPIQIGKIEAYLSDKALQEKWEQEEKRKEELKGKKVAIIGSGPSGLTCAVFLSREGAQVTIYEKRKQLGGLLRYGIPEFRLPKKVLDKTIESILSYDVKIKTEQELGKNLTLEQLKQQYDAVFLSFGANISYHMNIPGEEKKGVLGGNELLEIGKHPDYIGKKVAIIGGGNVAMDCARTIKRMGAEQVEVLYRRSKIEMPAEQKEIALAEQEGIIFCYQTDLLAVLGENKVEAIVCGKTELVEKEGEKRKVPVPVSHSEFKKEVDYVVLAIGAHPNKELIESLSLEADKNGYLIVDEKQMTLEKGVFAGGDIIGEKATVAYAAKSGREAAKTIKEYLLS